MEEIKLIVSEEARAVDDKEKKPLYSEEEKSQMVELLKTILTPEKMITIHHLNNAKLIIEWLMIFSRIKLIMKKEKLVNIVANSTAEQRFRAVLLALRSRASTWCNGILADVGKVEVGNGKNYL